MTTRELQEFLNSAGYPVVVDGIPGSETFKALSRWQAANGLVADGILGPKSLAKMGQAPTLITGAILKQMTKRKETYGGEWDYTAKVFNDVCPTVGIVTRDIFHEYISNVLHESGELTIKAENMNYTTPQRLVDVWPTRFSIAGGNGKLKAADYTNNAQKLANTVYANRMGNGDFNSGDGYRFRGGGPMQLTGEESYKAYYDFKLAGGGYKFDKIPSFEEVVELIRTDLYWGIDSAAWEFAVDKKLVPLAIGNKNFVKIVKAINGGTIGLADRQYYFDLAQKLIK